MTLHKSIEAAREVLKGDCPHEKHMQGVLGGGAPWMCKYCQHEDVEGDYRGRIKDALYYLPAKPMTEEKLHAIVSDAFYNSLFKTKDQAATELIRALRDAGVLYCSEEGK